MAYVAVSGGEEAIEASLALLRKRMLASSSDVAVAAIAAALPELVDQVMGESSLYDPTLAALALKQGGGSVEEAVFLLRAFRSTLERPYTSRIIDTSDMVVGRRISAAFKDIPGGQILGVTRDYSHRLLDFSLVDDALGPASGRSTDAAEPAGSTGAAEAADCADCAKPADAADAADTAPHSTLVPFGFEALPKVTAYLEEQGLLCPCSFDDTPPHDITMEPLSFPAPRSIRLQALARGMTAAVMALGYAAIRGFGPAHPTVGELRYGSLDILIDHPFQAGDEDDAYYVGAIAVTEVESLFSVESKERPHVSEEQDVQAPTVPAEAVMAEAATHAEAVVAETPKSLAEEPAAEAATHAEAVVAETPKSLAEEPAAKPGRADQAHSLEFGIGYGLVYGSAESKAIAMSVLDFCMGLGNPVFPTQDEEFVLYHIDGIEATGFISHLKLPHYVTFQSKLNSVRRTQEEGASSLADDSQDTCAGSPEKPAPCALGTLGQGLGGERGAPRHPLPQTAQQAQNRPGKEAHAATL
ncbi:MAG: carbon-phosphorus lyase complex subunit PhnI [Coriobacteriaceae bacterium]|jgi:alpha-D-ribose 1-methylphosphonate 5-triphosphate synthase subunit PhnI|nr:carbon-phosphorus lyase complex subunit PhnI [Coriobacteriaceae bacterium]